jgi:hypothetical protein
MDDDPLLPPVLRAIVRALGFARAMEWLGEFGGVNVTLPKHHTTALALSDDELARLRGHLARHLDAAGRLWLPKADRLLRRTRDECIRRQRNNYSVNALARLYRLSSRQIINICLGAEGDETQARLF